MSAPMTALPIPTAAPTRAAAGIVARVFTAWTRWKNRRQVAALLGLDDHLLRDIGVARGDVFDALNGPMSGDASRSLGHAAASLRQQEVMRIRESLRSVRFLTAAPRSETQLPGRKAA